MWDVYLERLLRRMVKTGTLLVSVAGRDQIELGDGTLPRVAVRITDTSAARRLLLDPELSVGESYVNGSLIIEGDDIQGLMAIAMRNNDVVRKVAVLPRILNALRRLRQPATQYNQKPKAQRNVAHHYDLDGSVYDLFLDEDRQYSCAYFADAGATLEAAQRAKKAHIARKLLISPGMHVLDIGCGWGGMALTLARDYGARVTGITLSKEQLAIARDRTAAAGLQAQVNFELSDYRDVDTQFDRIVSVGMFEHVGSPHFETYFKCVRDALKPDGVALIHTIGRTAPPDPTNPWIEKYIFPGGYVPSLSEVAVAIENAGLRLGDLECLRLHYALTLHHWFDRFSAKAEIAKERMGEEFVRMWRYYLAASEQGFRHTPQDVFQFQLSRSVDAVPITRDYLYRPKEELRQAAE
jgi:cyclopropane-fatty-acyl-phospholipid synthase